VLFRSTHKHTFDLRSGRCLEEPHVSVPAYAVRIVGGVVLVGPRKGVVTPSRGAPA
jgi:nitrite reductase (NADH) small subunit